MVFIIFLLTYLTAENVASQAVVHMGTAANADYYTGALYVDDDKTTGRSLPGVSSNEFWQARFETPQNVSRIVIFAKEGTEGYFGQFGIHSAVTHL